jgi:hypothetical protein
MISMLRGGRGGEVRLKLYLTLTLLAVSEPYTITRDITARTWAETLGLSDPDENGARRIREALKWLDDHDFVRVERRPGRPPSLRLLDPSGNGADYHRPRSRYVKLPVGYWDQEWITHLSASATALLIILLDLLGGKNRPDSMPASREQRRRYGLSPDSWTRATKELKAAGLLVTGKSSIGPNLDWRRSRTTYEIDGWRLHHGT